MQERPADLGERELAAALTEHWDLADTTLTYAPVGFGGYHWTAPGHFVTANDLAHTDYETLRAAMDTAMALADLGFAVAPLSTKDGNSAVRLRDRYALTLFPFVEAESGRFSDVPTPAQRADMAAVLARLHNATPDVAAPPRHDPALADRAHLDAALGDLARPWETGPYGEKTRALLAAHESEIREALAAFDAIAGRIASGATDLVITHGEPHRGNVLTAAGRLLLIDWDTARLAPPERDLWMGLADDAEARARYTRDTGHEVSEELVAFYERRWALDDIAAYSHQFRQAHEHSADVEQSWEGLVWWLGKITGV
ncbi:phosphotransferase [Phytomonospora sp. NPDC050363]|uniref:phosphotransferase enzyme family protein n=1 Tax=Phytomonospora sp. NPDC050363 TaxID=3155642 RepID=UPI0033DD9661